YLLVSPGHYGKSLCGKGLQPIPSSTLGYERKFNRALRSASMEEFVKLVTENPPSPPSNYRRIKRTNLGLD
ncbi:MAG: MBL fold metallo-hydrolase, partial [Candidatus Geothermarchaeales archaeon]